jgi:ribosome biogenesis protein YTM1
MVVTMTVDSGVQFEFLIDGKFLRTSLARYLDIHQLSTENVLTLEVVESISAPKLLSTYRDEDWIASVTMNSSG